MWKNFIIWTDSPVLSILVWVVVCVLVFFFARIPAQQLILSISRVLHNAFRLASRSLLYAARRMEMRNREVLLAAGRESTEKLIEREFERVNAVVKRDIQGYPALHRNLSDLVTKIDEDYRESTEAPPSPPGWLNAVESVAKIPSTGDTLVSNMLGEIKNAMERHHKTSIHEYRKASKKRHSLLSKMMPFWRKLTNTLEKVGKTIAGLEDRSLVIDNKMAHYEEILAKTDRAERMLSSSSLTQFVISGIVLLIAMGGAVVNFNLIALPMSEMVGGGSYIGPFKASNIAAMVIILVETAMGLYLMESLHITRLFPVIHTMADRLRYRMIWVTFSILLILACVEAALAFMRDLIAADMQILRQTLAGVAESEATRRSWIPTVGQMVMGFILPFALAFVAIPLESFVHSSRTVLGVVVVGILRLIAFMLRLTGNIISSVGEMLVRLYDLVIFPLLWVERLARTKKKEDASSTKEASQ
ncbi:MAG: hypothetical protein AB1610_07080 [Nitrospirota bacterium]